MPPRKFAPAHLPPQSLPGGSIAGQISLLACADRDAGISDDERSSSEAEVAPSTQASRASSKGKSKQALVEDEGEDAPTGDTNGHAEAEEDEDDNEIGEDEFVSGAHGEIIADQAQICR